MDFIYSSILALGIRSLLVNRLQKALQSQEKNQLVSRSHPFLAADDLSSTQSLAWEYAQSALTFKIPLNRVKDKTEICYVSAIALKLAGQQLSESSPMDLALEIGDCLEQSLKSSTAQLSESHPLERVWQNVAVQVAFPGWIYLNLTEQGVAEWLQILANQRMHLSNLDQSTSRVVKNTSSHLKSAFNIRDSTGKFQVLYSHARCCSLLRSAVRAGVISSDLLDFGLREVNLSLFKPHHSAEKNLISQIATVLDEISLDETSLAAEINPAPIWKSALGLSHSFEAFHQSCRIWGEVMQFDPQLTQMRLGLVLITQKVLRSLLEEGLAIQAPLEL